MELPITDVAAVTDAARDAAKDVAKDVTKRVRRAQQLVPPAALPRRFRRPAHRIHPAADASLVGLRLTLGSYLAGHGAQKLFGIFGGKGPQETGAGFEQLGLAP